MNEMEYIDVTNLAKIRAARSIIKDIYFRDGTKKQQRWQEIMAHTYVLEQELSNQCQIDDFTAGKEV